jgi:hypothetical protein
LTKLLNFYLFHIFLKARMFHFQYSKGTSIQVGSLRASVSYFFSCLGAYLNNSLVDNSL